jgi:UDP-N-acetylmuramate dehydrogenase
VRAGRFGVEEGVDLAGHTSFGIRTVASGFFRPGGVGELCAFILHCRSAGVKHVILGGGSKVLFASERYDGCVVKLDRLTGARVVGESEAGAVVSFEAGAGLQPALDFCRSRGLSGLEFLAGVPGTVGGAVVLNAGAFGSEIGGLVESVSVLDEAGGRSILGGGEAGFGYRGSRIGGVVLDVSIRLRRDAEEEVAGRIRGYLGRRRRTQPRERKTAGSVFKNPSPETQAWKLVAGCGLAGRRIGGACISAEHANFIVNEGGASGEDVLELIGLAQRKVRDAYGVVLEPDIKVIR